MRNETVNKSARLNERSGGGERITGGVSRREMLRLGGASILGATTMVGLGGCATTRNVRGAPPAASPPPFTFVHVTDTHISTKGQDGVALKKQSIRILEEIVEQINRIDGLDFCLFGGDNFDNSEVGRKDADAFVAIVKKLNMPFLIQFGNREASSMPPGDPISSNEFVRMFADHGFSAGKQWWSAAPVKGVRVLGLNSTIKGQNRGTLPAEELTWLKSQLAEQPEQMIIVLTHHLFLPTWAGRNIPKWQKNYVIDNASAAMELFNSHRKVQLVLSGHHHVAKVINVGGLPYVASPATVQYPCAFREISIRDGRAHLRFLQVRDKPLIERGRELLLGKKADEYGVGPGPSSVDAYCLGRADDQTTTLALRSSS